MIVGPHSTKLPQSWDTGSDQPSVPASFDVFLFHSIWQGAKPRTPTLRNTFHLTFPDRLPYLGIPGDDYLNVLMIFLFKHAVCVCVRYTYWSYCTSLLYKCLLHLTSLTIFYGVFKGKSYVEAGRMHLCHLDLCFSHYLLYLSAYNLLLLPISISSTHLYSTFNFT